MLVDAEMNDLPVKIQIDTGGVDNMLSEAFVKAHDVPTAALPSVVYGLGDKSLHYQCPCVQIIMNTLRKFHFYIAYGERKLYYTIAKKQ